MLQQLLLTLFFMLIVSTMTNANTNVDIKGYVGNFVVCKTDTEKPHSFELHTDIKDIFTLYNIATCNSKTYDGKTFDLSVFVENKQTKQINKFNIFLNQKSCYRSLLKDMPKEMAHPMFQDKIFGKDVMFILYCGPYVGKYSPRENSKLKEIFEREERKQAIDKGELV